MDRRRFLQATAAAALGTSAASWSTVACGGSDDKTETSSNDTPSGGGPVRKLKLGFIALTDCASVVMANELGYFAERNLEVEVLKQESWAATRDNLLNGQIDGAHCLFGMPFSVATIGGSPTRDLKITMVLNNNGQAITLANKLKDAGYADLDAAEEVLAAEGTPKLAMTFPGGTHDIWLRYWLLATGTKFADVQFETIPPPQMVANMTAGNMVGYCVGEPWGAVAIEQGIGFTHITTQDMWEHHPEKALVVGKRLTEETDTLKDAMGAILQASEWLDKPANRAEAADTLGTPALVNAPPDTIRGRLTGEYQIGPDLEDRTYQGTQMQFFRDGKTNFPRRAHGTWFLAQYKRMGLIPEAPPYQEIVDEIILSDIYAEVAEAEGIAVPDDDMAPFEVQLDGVTFDPAQPDEEAGADMSSVIATPEKVITRPERPSTPTGEVQTSPVPSGIASAGRTRAVPLLAAVAWGVVGFAVLVGIWALAATKEDTFPTPAEAFSAFTDMASDPFYDNGPDDRGVGLLLQASLGRVFKGFLIATVLAVPLGLLMGTARVWRAANPVVQLLKPVSPMAWFPLFLVLFKDVGASSVWVIFLIAMWPIVLNTAAGAAAVPNDQRDVAKVFRFGKLGYLRHVVIPHTLPQAVTGMRISMGICWMVIVAVEMLGGDNGIGRAIWDWYNGLRYDQMVAGIFFIGATGLVLDVLLLRLSKAVALEESQA